MNQKIFEQARSELRSTAALSAQEMESLLEEKIKEDKSFERFRDGLLPVLRGRGGNERSVGEALVQLRGEKILEIGPGFWELLNFLVHDLRFDPGNVYAIDINTITPDKKLSVNEGGIVPLGEEREASVFNQVKLFAKKYKINLAKPINELQANN